MQLSNRVAIVTGAGRGIGKAIAIAFAREGSHVVLVSRTASELESTRREIQTFARTRAEIFPVDVSQPEKVKELVDFTAKQFGTVDILVTCAGILGPVGLVTDVDSENWIQTIHTNLYGVFLCIKAVLPMMIKKKHGKIINFSGGGAVSPRPRFSAYAASKAAVVRLTETFAEEVKEYSIDINAIAPGAVNTRLLEEVLKAGNAAGPELAKAITQKQNGGTPPEKAAELAVFLASSKSDGLTGRLISAVWDDWSGIPQRLNEIKSSDIYTMRRIVPGDRGHDW